MLSQASLESSGSEVLKNVSISQFELIEAVEGKRSEADFSFKFNTGAKTSDDSLHDAVSSSTILIF